MFRFSLGTLLLFVSFTAVSCASLMYANETWQHVIFTTTVAALMVASISAVVRRGDSPFVVGFALIGWLYLVVVFTPMIDVRSNLLTTRALSWLGTKIHNDAGIDVGSVLLSIDNDGWNDVYLTGTGYATNSQGRLRLIGPTPILAPANFFVIGQSLWTLLLAYLGGWLACYFHRKNLVL